jgi:acetone carboxylase gamma subunit
VLEDKIMGDAADMILEGIVCQFCGVFLNTSEDAPGYPVTCDGCEDEDDAEEE